MKVIDKKINSFPKAERKFTRETSLKQDQDVFTKSTETPQETPIRLKSTSKTSKDMLVDGIIDTPLEAMLSIATVPLVIVYMVMGKRLDELKIMDMYLDSTTFKDGKPESVLSDTVLFKDDVFQNGSSVLDSPNEHWARKFNVDASADSHKAIYQGVIGDRDSNTFNLEADYQEDGATINGHVGNQELHLRIKNLKDEKQASGKIGNADYQLTTKRIDGMIVDVQGEIALPDEKISIAGTMVSACEGLENLKKVNITTTTLNAAITTDGSISVHSKEEE